ncbi:MAG: TIGR02757 family protein, partial [Proteobacteria bacterium]|nr:TIGR02757 family protein [Pseudomonadota bacterium]
LVASSLAYGRVAQILRSVRTVLDRMGEPRRFVIDATPARLRKTFSDFKHRFTTGDEMAAMLAGAARAMKRHSSLGACFASHAKRGDEDAMPALCGFVSELGAGTSLLSEPGRGSACKRLNMFLRWMVRRDEVDPGGWRGVSPAKLIVPLDTHMYKISKRLGFTARKAADCRTAREITAAFKKFAPDDPVRYDFSLTRLGIRSELCVSDFFKTL